MNVHSYCQKKVANLCGINQKLLAEALSQVTQVCTGTVYFSLCGLCTLVLKKRKTEQVIDCRCRMSRMFQQTFFIP